MATKRKQPEQPIPTNQYEALFSRFFAEFEASGFDTVVLTELHEKFTENHNQREWYAALPEEFEAEQAIRVAVSTFSNVEVAEARRWMDQLISEPNRYFEQIAPDRYRKCGGERPVLNYYAGWRLFLEYALRRVPKSDSILRELMLERIRHSWEQQRRDSEHKHHIKLMKRLEEVLHGTVNRAVYAAIYELRAYQVISPYRPRIGITEGDELIFPDGTADGDYPFGMVRSGVLTWTVHLHQLARAIHQIEPYLEYNTMTAYAICKKIDEAGVIVLQEGKFESVKKYLEQIYRRDDHFATEEYIPDAARIILSLLKRK